MTIRRVQVHGCKRAHTRSTYYDSPSSKYSEYAVEIVLMPTTDGLLFHRILCIQCTEPYGIKIDFDGYVTEHTSEPEPWTRRCIRAVFFYAYSA